MMLHQGPVIVEGHFTKVTYYKVKLGTNSGIPTAIKGWYDKFLVDRLSRNQMKMYDLVLVSISSERVILFG